MRRLVLYSMVMYAIALLAGCGSGRVQQLENENRALRQRINSCEERSAKIKKQRDELEKEIYAMKRGADYHYSIGCDAMNDDSGGRGYELAEKEFRLILQKWPASPVVKHARERLAEIGRQKEQEIRHIQEEDRRAEEAQKRKQEEARNQPLSVDDSIAEWKNFRRRGNEMQGRTTTWRFKLTNILVSGDIWGYLGWDDNEENRQAAFEYKVCISEYMQKDHRRNEFPEVKIDDWLVVTGEFIGVSPDGDVMLKPLRVVNEGYK